MPMIRRAPRRNANDTAIPESKEAHENTTVHTTRIILRFPNRSEMRPRNKPETAQLSARATAKPPHRVGKMQLWLDKRHHEIQRVTIKENDAEVQTKGDLRGAIDRIPGRFTAGTETASLLSGAPLRRGPL